MNFHALVKIVLISFSMVNDTMCLELSLFLWSLVVKEFGPFTYMTKAQKSCSLSQRQIITQYVNTKRNTRLWIWTLVMCGTISYFPDSSGFLPKYSSFCFELVCTHSWFSGCSHFQPGWFSCRFPANLAVDCVVKMFQQEIALTVNLTREAKSTLKFFAPERRDSISLQKHISELWRWVMLKSNPFQ